jgi:hypothetical protein
VLVAVAIVVAITVLRPPLPAAHHREHGRLQPAYSESA